ncbi:MAG: carbohydrate-binding protein [Desulfobacterales bacterium]|nr:carbohydrate-binding protein [Desulfobacterales bacterium]
MRKRIISTSHHETPFPDQEEWLNVEKLAEVEITSEDADYPIESALLHKRTSGWRASGNGKQIIRLIFSYPQRLRRIWLKFVETETERTQEYVLRWSADGGESFVEIVRQQWNFSPHGSTCEMEDHRVELSAITILELSIIPDISGGNAVASLSQFRIA